MDQKEEYGIVGTGTNTLLARRIFEPPNFGCMFLIFVAILAHRWYEETNYTKVTGIKSYFQIFLRQFFMSGLVVVFF